MIKKACRTVAAFVLILLSQGLYSQNDYKVSFYIHECDDSIIYIQGYCGSDISIKDSMKILKDGSFSGVLRDYHTGLYTVKSQRGDLFSFLLDKSRDFSLEVYPTGEYAVTGSPENDLFFMYQYENKKCQRAMYYYKLDVQKNPEKADSLRNAVVQIMDTFEVFQQKVCESYPDNLMASVTTGMQQAVPSRFLEDGKLKQGMEKEYAYYYRMHYWDNFRFKDGRILYTPYFIKQFNT